MAKAKTTTAVKGAPAPAKEAPAAPAAAPAPVSSIPAPRTQIAYPPFDELTKFFYGEPKSGKTTFADKAPHHFFIATEPGHTFVKSPVVRIAHWGWNRDQAGQPLLGYGEKYIAPHVDENGVLWTTFKDLVRDLWAQKKGGTLPYRNATVDIVDNLHALCLNATCAQMGIDYPLADDFGKSWKAITEEWKTWVGRLLDIINVSFNTHTATDDVKVEGANKIKKEIHRRIPTFRGNKAAQFLDGVINCIGFVHIGADGQRKITFQADETLATGDRTNLLERLGTVNLDWEEISKLYEAEAKKAGIVIKSKWAAT